MLNEGDLTVLRVGLDKYGGRVLADAATRSVPDISTAMLATGLARPYGGGKRQSWCGAANRTERQKDSKRARRAADMIRTYYRPTAGESPSVTSKAKWNAGKSSPGWSCA